MMALIDEIALGVGMMVLCTIIHSAFMVGGMRALRWRVTRFGHPSHEWMKAHLVSALTAWMFVAIALEAWLWALMYLLHPAITSLADMETALYFSMVTFTTLGYGDVVLKGDWRLLASIQAANGVIVFGWTTALLFVWIQQIFQRENAAPQA